jgi:ABC-type multidrug transport system fused ATPase/permease subunit
MIIVTHRTASVRHCDRILYLDTGVIRAEGTFDEVTASVPEFRDPAKSRRIAQAG